MEKSIQAQTVPPTEDVQDIEPAEDYDSWYSCLVSFSFHLALLLVLWLSSVTFVKRDSLSLPIQVIRVADGSAASMDSGGESTSANSPSPSFEGPTTDLQETPLTSVDAVTPIDIPVNPQVSRETLRDAANQQVEKARQAATSARSALANKMRDNLGETSKSGGSKGGASGGGGRAGRAARWVLRFDTSRPRDYLTQLGGLGAEIAFPKDGDRYTYFANLADNPTSAVRDLDREQRIYWIDESPASYIPVARELGVGNAPLMIAFLPQPLEDKMLKMELAFKGAQSEDDILQTVFKCLRRGGTYDVIIVSQKLRSE